MLKFIHGADFHLDAPFTSLPADQAAQRRTEQRELLDRLAELAEREQADLVLLSGDLLDSDHAYYETVQALSRTLGRMQARVFIAPGNHDFYAPRSPYATTPWSENVHIFTSDRVETVDLPELGCSVHGAAFTSPDCDRSPLAGFHAPQDGRIHLMALHGEVEGKARYGSIATADIAASNLNYLALGHIHAASGAQRAGETTWAYPGCPEGRGFDELGEKGVLVGSVDGGAVDLQFVPLCRRKYEILTVDVSDGAEAALAAALPKNAGADSYRILLTGESDGLDLSALTALAAPSFYSLSLRDQTHVRRDLWSRAGEDSLTGLFLRDLKGRLDAAQTDSERATIEKAVRFGLAALENREDCCP
ncbi:MAG: DNA repair exonuclease [Pseudoflavonifractor sp.]